MKKKNKKENETPFSPPFFFKLPHDKPNVDKPNVCWVYNRSITHTFGLSPQDQQYFIT